MPRYFKVLSAFVLPSFVSSCSYCYEVSAKVTRCEDSLQGILPKYEQQSNKILKVFKTSTMAIVLICLGGFIVYSVSCHLIISYLKNFINEFKNSGLDSEKILSEYRNNLDKESLSLLNEHRCLRENRKKLCHQMFSLSDEMIETMIHVYDDRKEAYDLAEDTLIKIQKIEEEIQKIWREKYATESKNLGLGKDFSKDNIEEFFKNCGENVNLLKNTDLITRIDFVIFWCEISIEDIKKGKISEDKANELSRLKNFAERVFNDECVKAKYQDVLDTLKEKGYMDAEDFYSCLNTIREYKKSENFVKILNLKGENEDLCKKLKKLNSELKSKKIKMSPPAYQKVKKIESDVRRAKEIIGKGPYTLAFLTKFSEYMKLRESFDTFKGTEINNQQI